MPRERGDLVVFSGGLDSTVCLAMAARDSSAQGAAKPLALTFDYGQRHRVEIERSKQIASVLGADQLVVELDAARWGGSALTDPAIPIADASRSDRIPSTYVPARNIVFLAIALGVAEARDFGRVHIGINAIDYSGYPDCRPEFLEAFREVARLGQRRGVEGDPVELVAPLVCCSKGEIVELGLELGAPLELTWSCYRGEAAPCGSCDACSLRSAGFAAAGVPDPALTG